MARTVADLVDRFGELPSPSAVFEKAMAIASDPEAGAGELVEALKMDPAIAGKALRLANSAAVGMPRAVSSLHNAVVILGNKRIHSLLVASELLARFRPRSDLPFALTDFWKHSVIVGLMCESISRHLRRYCAVDEGEAFCAGLLHDIGKLALGMLCPEWIAEFYARALEQARAYHVAESSERSHTAMGMHMARRWRLPAVIEESLCCHHAPQRAACGNRIIAIVHLADAMAHMIGAQTVAQEPFPAIDHQALEQTGLPLERLRTIAAKAVADHQRIESLLELTR